MKIIRIILLCGFLLPAAGCNQTVEFIPVRLVEGQRNKLVSAPELLSPQFKENFILVLKHYHEEYVIDQRGVLLIPRKLSEDKELLWNYCKKAEDEKFLEALKQ